MPRLRAKDKASSSASSVPLWWVLFLSQKRRMIPVKAYIPHIPQTRFQDPQAVFASPRGICYNPNSLARPGNNGTICYGPARLSADRTSEQHRGLLRPVLTSKDTQLPILREDYSVAQIRPSPAALLVLLAIVAVLLPGISLPVHAAQETSLSLSPTSEDPWQLQADRLVIRQEENTLHAFGNIVVKKGETRFQAEYARYNWVQEQLRMENNVRLKMERNSARAKDAFLDFTEQTGSFREAQFFLYDPHIYVTGSEIRKTGTDTYSFKSATLTSCDGEVPDWSLQSSHGTFVMDGHARMWHPRFRLRNNPMLYSPFMFLPAKRTRQSGFLVPNLSTSTQDGQSVTLSYYQVIDQERDLTLTAHGMSKRGAMLGAEYRFTPDLLSKGLARVDWLKDQKDEEDVEQFDNYERPSPHRFWLRSKYNGYLISPQWRTKLDLDFASDKFYLREFDYGILGFEDSRRAFLERFGRDINDRDDPIRQNVFSISRNWARVGLQTRVEYNQNLNYFNTDPNKDPTLQRLPQVDLDLHQTQLLDTPLEWEAQNQAIYFWRRKDDTTMGSRLDMHPRVSLPLQSAYGTLTPSLGWRETVYYTPETSQGRPQLERFQRRGIWDFSSRATTELFRVFELNPAERLEAIPENREASQWSMLKHTLRPQVNYDYIPEQDQSRLPDYDSVDRIAARNEITYSLTNLFTLRKDTIVASATGNGTRTKRTKSYRELVDLELQQSYDINEAQRSEDLNTYPRRPFSDIRLESEISPLTWISLRSTTWYSPYIEEITEHQHMLDLSHGPLSAFYGYDYLRELEHDVHRKNQEDLSIVRYGASLEPDPGWQLSYSEERDIESSQLIEREARLGYLDQCWKLGLTYTEEPEEKRVSLTIGLRPFGELEQGVAAQEQ